MYNTFSYTNRNHFLLVFFFAFTFFSSFSVSAQKLSPDFWHPGMVVTQKYDTIVGKIKYNIPNNIIQVDLGHKKLTMTALRIKRFTIMDITDSTRRDFQVFPFQTSRDYNRPVIFEVLQEGSTPLLTREHITLQSQGGFANQGFAASVRVLAYDYFYLAGDGLAKHFRNNRKGVMKIFSDYYTRQMQEYIKENRLHYGFQDDLIAIFEHYNQLKGRYKSDESTASGEQ